MTATRLEEDGRRDDPDGLVEDDVVTGNGVGRNDCIDESTDDL